MPGQVTYTDALDYLILAIARAGPNDAILTDTTTRLGVAFANRDDGPELLEGFRDAYFREASNVRYREQLRVVMRGKN